MGRSLVFSTNIPLEFSQNPRSFSLLHHSKLCFPQRFIENSQSGYKKIQLLNLKLARNVCTKAALSEITNERKYPKVGAPSTGPISANQLIQVVETAAKTGAEVWFLSLALSFKDSLTE
jgi:myo-inositol-1(or 4)-monophosphatase